MSIFKRGPLFLACTLLLCTMLPFAVFAGPESESEPVDMVMYVYDARPAEFQALSDAYKELHPNVTVETIIPATDFFGSLTARIASNTMPDIVMGEYQGLYDLGKAGHMVNLNGLPLIDHFDEAILPQMTAPDGNIYGVPTNFAAMGIMYNKDMFDQVGIDEFPTTISGLEDAVDRLRAAGFTPFSVAGLESWTHGQMFYTAIASVQPDVFQYANDGATGDILLQEHLVAMRALDLQWDNSLDESEGSDYGTFINHFATEQVAMIQMGTWALNHVLGLNPDVNMRYAAVPYSENPDDARLSANIGVSLGVGTQTEHRDEAIQFLDWITSVEGNTVYSELFREIPVVTGVDVPLLPAAEDVLRYKDAGAIVPWSQVLMSEAGRAEGSAIMQQYFLGEISAEQAIRGVYENWFK